MMTTVLQQPEHRNTATDVQGRAQTDSSRQVVSNKGFEENELTLRTWSGEHQRWEERTILQSRFNTCYKFVNVYTNIGGSIYETEIRNITSIAVAMELTTLLATFKFLTLKDLHRLSEIHSIRYRSQNKRQLVDQLVMHKCSTLCGPSHVVIFKSLPQPRLIPTFVVPPIGVSVVTGIAARLAPAIQQSRRLRQEPPSRSQPDRPNGGSHKDAGSASSPSDHLAVLPDDLKWSLLTEWERNLSTEALKVVVCAVCGEKASVGVTFWRNAEPQVLALLQNPKLPVLCRPVEYAFELYNQAILNWKGLQYTNTLGMLRCCKSCSASLDAGKMPRLALANFLYTAHSTLPTPIKDAFDASSPFEKKIISRARFNNICCKFNTGTGTKKNSDSQSSEAILSRARKGVRGNIMVVPLDTIRMNRKIPPSTSTIRDTMCVVFVGATKPSADAILSAKTSPVLVRKSRVKTMIQFLLEHNPHYRPRENVFEFSSQNLSQLFDSGDEGIPGSVEIGYIEADEVIDVSTADYTPRNSSSAEHETDELLMENIGYTDGNTSAANYFAMKALALERCRRQKPFLYSGTGNTPVPEFQNPSILAWLFPHLDPWGIAGFNHVERKIKLSLEEQVRHFLHSDNELFERDTEFAFVFFNVIRKMTVARSIRFSVLPSIHRRLAADMMSIDPETLLELGKKFEHDPMYKPTDPNERKAQQVMASLTMIARHIPGSNGHKVLLRNQIRALISYRGPPTIFITLNPSDVDSPIVRLLAGEDIDLDDISRGEDMDPWQRRLFAAQHPGACAKFFHLMMTNFIKVALKFNSSPPEPGVFGICKAYYGTVEAQGKGTLHCHMLLWLEGHLSPQGLRDAMLESDNYRDRVFKWVESVIKCEFPIGNPASSLNQQPTERVRHFDIGNPHPGVIAAPFVFDHSEGENLNWTSYNNYLVQLLNEYNWHVHNATCWKYLRRGEPRNDQNCRLRMDGMTRELTSLDPETGALLLRRHHPRIAAYNDLVTVMFKSNTEVKFIGSGRAARDLVFYITDYVTKPSLPMHVGMVALKYAIGKVGEKIAETVDGLTASFNTSAVIMAVNSMMGRQEISQPQVMAELIGGGDHYTSETFSTLNWGQVLSYVDSATSHEEEEIGDARNDALDSDIPMNVDIRSDSVTASTQTLDYMFRNEEQSFDLLCLYDFAATTCKTSIPKSLLLSREIEDIPGSFSSWDHPQRSTHHLNHRRHPHVPVLLGPAIPNAERSSDTREKWAKCILILFKPWRNPMDIKNDHETWLECYERYKVELSPIHQTIIRNMNAFSESQDARGTVPERSRTRVTDLDDLVARADMHLPSPTDEFDDDGDALWSDNEVPIGVNAGNSVVQDVYQCTERTLTHIAMLNNITASRLGYDVVSALDRCYDPTQIDLDQDMEVGSREVAVNDLPTIISDQTFMREQKIKRRRPEADIPETHVTDASNRIQVVVEPQVEIMTIDLENQLRRRFPSRSGGKNVADIVQNVIEKMNLESNCEQLKAFKLVADHLVSGNIEQLLMYVSGVGGTGKSHVIKSIVELFSSLGIRNQLLLGAPTGIAAVLIGGQTLHSLAFVGPRRKGGNLEHLTSMWKDVRYLIVDEVSMIGARFLSELSNRIREAKYHHPDSCSMPFGGVNVIFMGDFGQLKPPAQTALYSHRITEHMSFKTASCIDGISAMNGVLLWRQIKKVVQLVKNHRQAGDPDYAEFLSRIRLGICVPDPRIAAGVASRNDWNYLLDRVLSKLDQATLQKFDDAPIIVGTKVTRDILNAKRICYDAARLRKSVNLYHSVDTMDRVPVRIGLRNRLWNIPSSSNNDAFGRLPLFNGMKVMVTENIAFFHGVVNGSEGVVQSVYHNEDSDGNMVAVVAYVLIPGCGMHLPHLEKDVVPIFPVATRINFTIKVSNHATVKGFTRKQLPLVPAYAYTDFKSQGRTLTNVIVDLYTAKGQGVYVMLSRVKSISGLAVLRWFPPSKVYDRLSAELRNELDRLDTLSGDRDI